MNPLKVRIVGSGGAAEKHAIAYGRLPELFQVVKDDTADIIDICNINCCHFGDTANALRNAHVIVEKPIAGSLQECDALLEAQRVTGRRIFPIFQYRYTNRDRFEHAITATWPRERSYYDGWRGRAAQALGGCLVTHGIHTIDLFIERWGRPEAVRGMASEFNEHGVESVFMGTLYYPEHMAMFGVSTDSEISGDDSPDFNFGDPITGYVNQFQKIAQALERGVSAPVTLEQARAGIEAITGLYYSSALDCERIPLPLESSHPFYQGWQAFFQQRSGPSQFSLKIPG